MLNLQIHEVQQTQNRINLKKIMPGLTEAQLMKMKIQKDRFERRTYYITMNNVLKVTDFSTETMEASRQWNHIFQASDMVSSRLLRLWGHFPVHLLGVFRSPFL